MIVAEPFVDNDVSAFQGKRRERYEDVLALVAGRRVDQVVVYMTSRLWRNRRERAHGIEVFQASGAESPP